MRRRLLLLNLLLVGVSLALVVYIARQVTPRAAASATRARPASLPTVAAPGATAAPSPPAGNYGVVASRNLFSPTRSETASPTAAATGSVPTPNLYGVVLRDGAPIAYLEDSATKRVAGYRLGDTLAGGGTIQRIAADRVVFTRPEGQVEVRLNDPGKPRPQPAPSLASGQTAPGQVVQPSSDGPQAVIARFPKGWPQPQVQIDTPSRRRP